MRVARTSGARSREGADGPTTVGPVTRPILYFDVVRGLSAQAVLVGHSLNIFFPGIMMSPGGHGYVARGDVLYVQNLGVLAFFVLSGYLVTRSLTRKPTWYGAGDYVVDRAARIFVPFLPAVLVIWATDLLVFGGGRTSQFTSLPLDAVTGLANLTMTFQNPVVWLVTGWFGQPVLLERLGSADPFWTVAIEWWLYLAFGLLWLATRHRVRWHPVVVLVLLFAVGTTLGNAAGHPTVVAAWLIGMAYAMGVRWVERVPAAVHGAVVAAAALTLAVQVGRGAYDMYAPLVALALSVGLMSGYQAWRGLRTVGPPRPAVARLVEFVAGYSYSLYLVHFSVLISMAALLPPTGGSGILRVIAGFLLANLVAIGFWWCFERHYPRVGRALHGRLARRREVLRAAEERVPAPAPA